MIEIKTPTGKWCAADEHTALLFVNAVRSGLTAIPESKKNNYINENRLRGITVEELLGRRGKTESAE